MDDFEKAIIYSFDQSGGVNAQLKAQALSYCEQAKRFPNIMQACLEKLRVSQFAEVQFWCLQTLEELVKARYSSMDVQDRTFLQTALLSILCSYGLEEEALQPAGRPLSRPAFVKNKLAQIIVILVCIDYPSGWPSVFLDLQSFLVKGPGLVDMFCRVLNTLDEEIISLDYPRKQEEIAVATRIKDSMRRQCVSDIVGTFYNLVVAYKSLRPQLAGLVLQTLQRCIAWIDINLVANDTFIPIIFDLVTSPQESVDLKGAAVDCILAIVSKRMDASLKLSLLHQLQIGRICGPSIENQGTDLALKLSALLTGYANEVLDCHKKLSGKVSSNQGASAEELLDVILPSIFYFLQSGEEETSSMTFQFFSNYVNTMKTIKFSGEKQASHLTQILDAIRKRLCYDPEDEDSLNLPDKAGKEEEERMSEFRKDLLGLFRNIYRFSPSVTISFVKSNLAQSLGNPDVQFQEAEAAITLFYVLGEGLTEECFKYGNSDVEEMANMLFTSQISCHSHRLVAISYLETVTRYSRFMQKHPEYIPVILGVFLDKRGIHHPNHNVSGRASYLFMRFVKMLRLQLLPYLEVILQSLQDILAEFTTGKMCMKLEENVGYEDGSHAFEAIGLLIGMEELSEDKQTKFLSLLLLPLCSQVDSLLASRPPGEDTVGPSATALALQRVIVAINSLSKGFGEQLTTTMRPAIGVLFKQALDVLLHVLQVFPKNRSLRGKVVSFLHRMIETLGSAMFPFLPTIFQQLLLDIEPREMVELLVLINQLMGKFKSEMRELMLELFSFIVARIFSMLPKEALPDGPGSHTEEVQELKDLERTFYTFMHTICQNNLSSTFLSSKNNHLFNDIIQSILCASCEHRDALVRKVCVQIFIRLIKDWCSSSVEEEKVPGFRSFVVETFAAKCCVFSVLDPSFNLRDANTFSLFGEIVSAQKVIYEQCGNEFLIHLATKVLPAVQCPPNLAEQYCLHIQCLDVKDLKPFYKNLVEKLRPQQNGSMVSA